MGLEKVVAPMENFGYKFDNVSNLSENDTNKLWDLINNTKFISIDVGNDGTVIFNLNIRDQN